MFKKYLLIPLFLIAVMLFVSNHSFAYKSWTNNCISNNDTQTITVVSSDDLSPLNGDITRTIPVCISAQSSQLPITILDSNHGASYTITSVDSNNHAWWAYEYNFSSSPVGSEIPFTFSATDNNGNATTANLTVKLQAAPITLTIHNNTTGADVASGGSVSQGDSLTFSCTNSTYMGMDATAGGGQLSATSDANYNMSYGPTTTIAVGSHTVGCANIGTPSNDVNKSFTVVANMITGSLTASPNPCIIASGASSCSTTLSWSTTNPVGTSAVTSETDSTGASYPNNNIDTSNSGSKSVNIPYLVLGSHQGRNFYLYNNGQLLGQVNVTAECASGNNWDGSKCVKSGCPAGEVADSTGYCHVPCVSGYSWDEPTRSCVLIDCPSGYAFDSNTGQCELVQSNPVCTWTDNTYTNVTCSPESYVCPAAYGGGNTYFQVFSSRGLSGDDVANFPWENGQIEYRYYCGNQIFKYHKALVRPYTHFMTFNVSAGFVTKGSGVNLSWTVQDPNNSCKIVGKSIKTGNEIFNSKTSQSGKLDSYIATSTGGYSTAEKDMAVGDYKTIIGDYYKVNESVRFTASCTNTGVYKPGYYQLVRDVYVTDEGER